MPTTDNPQRRPWTGERTYRVLIGAAIGWGIVILVLAATYPAESVDTGRAGVQPMRSLVAADGYGVLWAAIPLLTAIIVGCLHRARPDARWALIAEWILSGALLLASLAGFVTIIIGIYVLPAAALLVIATGQAASRQAGASRLPESTRSLTIYRQRECGTHEHSLHGRPRSGPSRGAEPPGKTQRDEPGAAAGARCGAA